MHPKSFQLPLTLCNPINCNLPGSSVHGDSPGKNIGMSCHALLQGIFLTQGSNSCLLYLLHCGWILYREHQLGSPVCWRQWHPTPVLLPGKPMDRGVWWAALHGVAKSRAWLSDFTFTFYFHALEKDMATHSSILAWRIPGVEELLSMGLHKVGHDWSDLAAMINNVSHPLVFLLAFHITYFV